MFAQQTYRPEIARVAEETVLNLKQLETRIEILKNDLAALCTVVGLPEAARIAVTPAAWLGVTQPHLSQGLTTQGTFGMSPHQTPFGYGSPYGQNIPQSGPSPWGQGFSPWSQNVNPYQGVSPFGQGITPYGNPYAQGVPGFR